MIIKLQEEGKSLREIERIVRKPDTTIKYIVDKFLSKSVQTTSLSDRCAKLTKRG